jgi:glutamate dehydrogenase/leucine dehydrogenase/CBS domain-containing protein
MIPGQMEAFLNERLPERTFQKRLIRNGNLTYMEFGPLDVDRLSRLGIEVDDLGPRLVVCMWDEASPLEIGGYLVIDNLAMGSPSMGGIRMLPDVTPATIHNLARGMTLKNAAADLPYGGGKAGIVAQPDLEPDLHNAILRGFARLLRRYKDMYLPGPDVGTNDADMMIIAIENGLDNAVSKPAEMGGNCIDEVGAAAGGVIIALDELIREMGRLRVLPQFKSLYVPLPEKLTILIQGFGAVGAHSAHFLDDIIPGAKVIGISDESGYLYAEVGLPVDDLFKLWQDHRLVARLYDQQHLANSPRKHPVVKFANSPDDMLRESAFCLIPAAPVANYLDTETSTHPSITVDHMGRWSLILEGANTYSPNPERRATRSRMERSVYRHLGVMIATDYLVNSGGVIFAAQERLIKTPPHLRIPDQLLGKREIVEEWCVEHAQELSQLAERRREAAIKHRDGIIRRNIRELIDLLIKDTDTLPCEAAERISIRRIAASESDRTAADIMLSLPTISIEQTVRQAAALLVEAGSPILAVVSQSGELCGVVTEWDITRATARGSPENLPIQEVMTGKVISADPNENLLEVIRKLEYHEISAMPVVKDKAVLGMVSTDLLARGSLLRLLQSHVN